MKKIAYAIALMLLASVLLSCRSSHVSQNELTDMLQSTLKESLHYETSSTKDELKTYIFSLEDRGISFEVISYSFTDGSGEALEDILIYYEKGIASAEKYKTGRAALAKEYGVTDNDRGDGTAVITADGYGDLNKIAEFIAEVDRLYAFLESDPEGCVHINCGMIELPQLSIEGVPFSYSADSRLSADVIRQTLAQSYILQLKRFGFTDEEIPAQEWDAVDPGFEEW